MRLGNTKPAYDWYNWHRPAEDKGGRVTFIGVTAESIFQQSEAAMVRDLAASGINAEYIKAIPNAAQAPYGDRTGEVSYTIPYYDLQGKLILDANGFPVMFRRKRFLPETADPRDKKDKYKQPGHAQIGNLANIPYIHPDVWALESDRLIITEGEKKAAAIMAHLKIPAIAIGGCQNWRAAAGDNNLHPYIVSALERKKPEVLIVVPDGDYRKFHIQTAYGGMLSLILDMGLRVEVRVPPRNKKIDDLIVEWESADQFEALLPEPMDANGRPNVVEPPPRLIEQYGLVTVTRGNAARGEQRQEIIPNSTNVHTLIAQHPAFTGQFWYNIDNISIMNGDNPMHESDANEVLNFIQRNLSIPKASRNDVREAISQIANRDARSPRVEWLRKLKWDKKPRLATWLIDYIGADDTPLVREAGTKFLVGAVKRQIEPGCLMDWMLILHGPQGVGKSSLPRILFGLDDVVPVMHTDDGKDFKALFHKGWCVNFEELEVMGKRDIEGLKAIISSPSDIFRPPYGRTEQIFKRRCVLYGSTNSPHFLPEDPTGYRRYVVAEMRQVQFKKLEEDREQLWAEAMHLYGIGGTDVSQVMAVFDSGVNQYAISNDMHDAVIELLRTRSQLIHTSKNNDGEFYAFKFADVMRQAGYSDRDIGNNTVTKPIKAKLYALGWRKADRVTAGLVKPYVIPASQWEFHEHADRPKF